MSVAAAELPELARLSDEPIAVALSNFRCDGSPSMLASSLLLIAAGGRSSRCCSKAGVRLEDTSLVWLILVFYAFGLPAIGLSRMLQNASFAMGVRAVSLTRRAGHVAAVIGVS